MTSYLRLWWLLLAAKIALAIWLPFANDEAYYWVWGHHPHLSYYDHPPMVGWLFSLGTVLESFGNAARLPGVILGHLTLLLWGEIVRPHLEEKRLVWWLAFVSLSPFMGIGSLVLTPDVPMMFFWALSLLIFLRLLDRPTPWHYLALGAALGLGFCSKYPIVLFVPIAIGWLAYSRRWRQLRWEFVPLTIVSGLICAAPVILWNASHDWVSFKFQLEHGLGAETKKWGWPLEYLGAQLAILFPTVVFFAWRGRNRAATNYLSFFGWLPILFFLFSSFQARVEANWPIAAHPALLSLAFITAPEGKWWRWTAAVWAAATVIVLSQVAMPWIPMDPKKLKTSEFTRFDAFVPEASPDREIYFGSYQMASAVSYKLRRQYYKLPGLNRRDFYDFHPHSLPKSDRFFLGVENDQTLPQWLVERGYQVANEKRLTDDFKLLEVSKVAKDTDR